MLFTCLYSWYILTVSPLQPSRLAILPCLLLQTFTQKLPVAADERDSTVPKCERPTLPVSVGYVPPNGDIGASDMAASLRPEAKPLSPAAAFQLADLPGADPLLGGLVADSDSIAEKVAELSMGANPAGLRPPKEGNKERENLLPLKAHS